MWVKNQKLEPDIEQLTDAKLGKEYDRAVYCHSAYLPYMQSMSCEMPGWMNHKLESRLPRRRKTCDIKGDLRPKIPNQSEELGIHMKQGQHPRDTDLIL